MARELRRKTPEELLLEVQAAEAVVRQGRLKIFLGYASGVGKTYRMFDEARRRRERGQDIVVGGVQPCVPPEAETLLATLETIPPRTVGQGTAVDVEALIRRRPAVCVIDGLAYDNPPGALRPSRWQDVQELIGAGMKVITSVNIQYVAELGAQIEAITGKRPTQTVPLAFLRSADEIEIVDAPPEALREDSGERGLSKLRELTLVVAAEVVDQQLTDYLEQHGIQQQYGAFERILVCLTPRANARRMIKSASDIARRFHGELIAAYVSQPAITPADRAALEERLDIARSAGACVEILNGEDPVDTILEFARARGVTQLFIGHSLRSGLRARLLGNPVDRLIRRSRGMDVHVFPH